MGAVQFNPVTRGYAVTLAPAGKYPIVGDRIYKTLQDAQDYVDGKSSSRTAIPGIYLSVIADGDNNGAYWVAQAADYDGATVGILQKIDEGGGGSVEGLGSLAYKNSLSFVELTNKPTTLSGYGITDAVIYQNGINTATDFKKYGYGHATGGWRGSGPAMIFGMQNYNTALQSSNEAADYVSLYVRNKYNGVEYGWDRIVTEGLLSRGAISFDTSAYKCLGDIVIHRNLESGETFLNFGVASTDKADLRVFGYNIDFIAGEASAYKTYLKLYADGYAEFKVPLFVTGGNVGIGTASPACALDVNGDLNSRNFVKGGALTSDPTDSFQTAIFGSSDSSFYKMRLMRKGTATDGINTAYSPIFAMKTADTHSFLAISYNTKDKCYIGGGSGDAIIWSSVLYHNNMDLIPEYDHSYTIGSASLRYKSLAVSDSVQIGDATLSWDATAGMLKIDKGVYSEGAITAKKRA